MQQRARQQAFTSLKVLRTAFHSRIAKILIVTVKCLASGYNADSLASSGHKIYTYTF